MSLYLEVEFHDTKTGADWIRNNISKIGEAIAKGMCNYYGVKYKAPTSTTSAPKKETATSKDLYYVQVGAYSKKANADAMVKKLKTAGFDAIVKSNK
ncbi:MAG: SPOR domain-containing protein [Ruminococcus sp.]|nr:SPOR domain-containing protein [Ruminococcus sp.]